MFNSEITFFGVWYFMPTFNTNEICVKIVINTELK